MTLNLLSRVSQFESSNDRESDTAFFRTHVPWVAPDAYLHIIFKRADMDVLEQVSERLGIPCPLINFLSEQNGAILFSGAISIYGVRKPGQLLNRDHVFSRSPFDITQHNLSRGLPDSKIWLAIGGYSFDGSRVCMDRRSFQVCVFHPAQQIPYHSWTDLDHWLDSEIDRLSTFFDTRGRRLTTKVNVLPSEE